MKIQILMSAFVVSLSANLPTAYASDDPVVPSPLMTLYECANITVDSERLACFDSKVSNIRKLEENKEFIAIDKATAKSLKKESFGFNLPSIPKLGKLFKSENKSGENSEANFSEDSDRVSLILTKANQYAYQKMRFYFDNGQVWDQVNSESVRIPKGKDGKPNIAKIRKAAFGSYLMTISGNNRSIRVRRVE